MKKLLLTILIFTVCSIVKAQSLYTVEQSICPPLEVTNALLFVKNDKKSQKFEPYVRAKHGAGFDFESFKKNNKIEYCKELWYYSQSFYVKKNHNKEGESLDETIIDISRFESYRNNNTESIITLDGFKDAIVLLPTSKLIFKND